MNINDIILKSVYGTLTAAEQTQLEAWLTESDSHRRVYDDIVGILANEDNDAIETLAGIDVENALKHVKAMSGKTGHAPAEAETSHRMSHLWSISRWAAAACVVGVIAFAAWWHMDYAHVTAPVLSEQVQKAMHECEAANDAASEKGSAAVVTQQTTTAKMLAAYNLSESTAEDMLDAKNITTHRGHEYWLTLDDGTVIHLNNNTRVIYPEHFGRSDREVILDGEAYFMVAKDRSRPFIVHTPNGDVKVYGTEFNVNTRCQSATEVVLVHGSVSVTPHSGSETMITPGEKAVLTSTATVSDTDLAPYTAWNEGKFFFREWQLSRIMEVIGKWYGRKVVFNDDAAKGVLFSGNFDRYDDIMPTMESIASATDLNIKVTDTEIIINK